jgi:hypothetical protein
MIESRLTQFLIVQAKADKTRHSKRSLFDHLVGTHDLLQRWGNRDEVCDAGLFHSIYGTRHFRHQSYPLENRHVIRELIGHNAEWLAYLFCAADRPRVLLVEAPKDGPHIVTDHFREMELVLTPAELRDLREIETANLIEQGSTGKWLAMLRSSNISDPAKAAIDARETG